MIFNKDNNGSAELMELTGSYYKSNKFEKMGVFIERAQEELVRVVGQPLMDKAEKLYKEDAKGDDATLLRKMQKAVAILATMYMYQHNDISHEDSGRKFKIDNDKEKLPWEWQLDRDDARQLEDYYKEVDSLIRFLEEKKVAEWIVTRKRLGIHGLLIRSGEAFNNFFPLNSERMYILLLPWLKEAQRKYIVPVFGHDDFDELLNAVSKENADNPLPDVYDYACAPLALYTISIALTRMPLSLIPQGVVTQYLGESGGMKSEAPSLKDVKIMSQWLADQAKSMVEDLKIFRRENHRKDYQLLPENDKNNKYMQL